MKNIILCTDGTWDHPHHPEEKESDSNVRRILEAFAQDDNQLAIYDVGVGADVNLLKHVEGGVFGEGLLAKVRAGYQQIAEKYEAGDAVHLFGFSRGAYTARSIAGMLAICGLPSNTESLDDASSAAFKAYRDAENRLALLRSFDKDYGHVRAHVSTIGVWDTVGALGIPAELFENLDARKYGFLDTTLHADVGAAFQALSIDERRPEYKPTLWKTVPRRGQTLEQVWFPGVHCDVGGGYKCASLSEITLLWMMRKAQAQGLRFKSEDAFDSLGVTEANANGQVHRSWKVWFGVPEYRVIPEESQYSDTVKLKFESDEKYRPPNLPRGFPQPSDKYRFYNYKF